MRVCSYEVLERAFLSIKQQKSTGKVLLSLAEKTIVNFENKFAALKDRATKAQGTKARRQRNIRRRALQQPST